MRTNLSKKLLAAVLSLAMVLSLVGVQPSSANAAAKYSVTKRANVTADKAYTYKVTGVKKTQYIKVTKKAKDVVVKYNNKAVSTSKKINGTGKALSLKVTAPDKVANYKNAMTIKVYNKKTNKLVKTLKTTSTVKVTELAITAVEAATYETGTNQVKYLLVSFNKALDSLDASEVTIRRALDDQLFTVEKVVLAKNGKSATITLLGNDQTTATATSYLQPLVDYKLAVNQSNVTANMTFNIPAFDTGVVSAYNLAKKSITVNGTPLFVNNLKVDYFDLLGTVVNVKYDADQNLISVVKAETKIVYATLMSAKTANADGSITLVDLNTGDKYETQVAPIGSNAVTTVATVGDYATSATGAAAVTVGYTVYPYAKVVFNPNGTVKRIVQMPGTHVDYLVRSTKDNYVNVWDNTGVKAEKNLKDFTIIKDNKLVDVTAIKAGDMLAYDSTNHYVVVYTNTEKTAIKAVYDVKATFGNDSYTYGQGATDDLWTTQLIIDDTAVLTGAGITEDELNAVKAGGDVTMYFSFDGSVSFITGSYGEVKTTSNVYVLTKTFGTYLLKNEAYLYGQVSNGTETIDIDIPVASLKYVDDKDATAVANDYFRLTTPASVGASYATIKLTAAGDINLAALAVGDLLIVERTKDGSKIVGLYSENTTGLSRTAVGTNLDLSKNPAIAGLVTTANTPLFYYNSAKKTVTATTLGAFNNTTKGSVSDSYVYNGYDANAKTADYIVIFDTDITNTTTTIATLGQYVVVDTDIFTNDLSVREVENLYVMKAGTDEVIKLTAFEDATAANLVALAKGDIVTIGFDSKGVLVTSDGTYDLTASNETPLGYDTTQASDKYNASSATSTTLTLATSGGVTLLKHADADHSTIVYHLKSNGSFELISWDDLVNKANDATPGTLKSVTYNHYKDVSGVLDVIIAVY